MRHSKLLDGARISIIDHRMAARFLTLDVNVVVVNTGTESLETFRLRLSRRLRIGDEAAAEDQSGDTQFTRTITRLQG